MNRNVKIKIVPHQKFDIRIHLEEILQFLKDEPEFTQEQKNRLETAFKFSTDRKGRSYRYPELLLEETCVMDWDIAIHISSGDIISTRFLIEQLAKSDATDTQNAVIDLLNNISCEFIVHNKEFITSNTLIINLLAVEESDGLTFTLGKRYNF